MNLPKGVGKIPVGANKIGLVRQRADVIGFGALGGTKFPNGKVHSMIGIVLVAHGRLGAEFRAALEHVASPQKQIESIAIGPDDDIEERRQDIVSAVTKVDDGTGVVVLTDMEEGLEQFGRCPAGGLRRLHSLAKARRPDGAANTLYGAANTL
jgi:hypothetical protein